MSPFHTWKIAPRGQRIKQLKRPRPLSKRDEAIKGSYKKILRKELNRAGSSRVEMISASSNATTSLANKQEQQVNNVKKDGATMNMQSEEVVATTSWHVEELPTISSAASLPVEKNADCKNRVGISESEPESSYRTGMEKVPQKNAALSKNFKSPKRLNELGNKRSVEKPKPSSKTKAEKNKIMSKKTKKGQPVMSGRIQVLLDKIRKD